MKTTALIFACLLGPLTFGFLFAGFIQLMIHKDGRQPSPAYANFGDVLVILLDALGLLGTLTALLIAARNWPERPEARRFIYAGAISGLVTATLLLLAL